MTDVRDMRACFADDLAAETGRSLNRFVLVQQGLLIALVAAGIGTAIRADGVWKEKPLNEK